MSFVANERPMDLVKWMFINVGNLHQKFYIPETLSIQLCTWDTYNKIKCTCGQHISWKSWQVLLGALTPAINSVRETIFLLILNIQDLQIIKSLKKLINLLPITIYF